MRFKVATWSSLFILLSILFSTATDALQHTFPLNTFAEEPTEPVSPGEEPSEPPGEEPEHARAKGTSILIILSCLIIVSILFEYMKDVIGEKASKNMKPIVDAMWGELTVGGFLGLLFFILGKSEVLNHLSSKIFGESDEGEKVLSELLEMIHVVILLVVVVYLFLVLFILFLAQRVEKRWKKAEKAVRDHQNVMKAYIAHEEKKQKEGLAHYCNPKAYLRGKRAHHRIEYMQLRRQFIEPRDPTHPKLDENFDYAQYLSEILGKTLAKIVTIHPYSWMFLELVFVAFYAASFTPKHWQIGLFLGFGYVLLVAFFIISRKLDGIRAHLLPPRTLDLAADIEAANETSPLTINIIAPDPASDPLYVQKQVRGRTKIGKIILGDPPNKHEILFWFDRKGPGFLLHVIRTLLLLTSVYLSVFFVNMSELIDKEVSLPLLIVLIVVALLPAFIIVVVYVPHIVRRHVVTCNVELLKKRKIIQKIIRLQRTKRSIRAIKMLQSLRSHAKRAMKLKNRSKADIEANGRKRRKLPAQKEREIRDIFRLFDKDNSGQIDANELSAFFKALGQEVTGEECQNIISIADLDGDGLIDIEEFLNFMAEESEEKEKDAEEVIKDIFQLFDRDQSGAISVQEFKTILSGLGQPEKDVDDLIRELDEDGDGEIDLEEFAELMKRFLREL